MTRQILSCAMLLALPLAAPAQTHGTLSFQSKTITLTGYRTKVSEDKRCVIADGKDGDKLYSVTVTLRPDISQARSINTDRTHSVTVTVSNADNSAAQNFCFDGGGALEIAPGSAGLSVSGTNLPAGNCFGITRDTPDRLSFTMKP